LGPFLGALLAGFFQISNLQSMQTLKEYAEKEEYLEIEMKSGEMQTNYGSN
jgi:hypothetical protein